MTRKWRRLATPAVALLVALSVAGCAGSSAPAPPPASVGARVDRPVPAAIQRLALTTSTGARTSLAALHGKFVVLTDFLTLCGEVCPMTSANMNQMARAVSHDGLAGKVVFVEVTVDPQRDTPARLAAYRALYPAAAGWVLARMAPGDLATFCHFFGIAYMRTKESSPPDLDWLTHKPLGYDVAHQDALVYLDARGHERFVMLGPPNAGRVAPPSTLASFLDAQGRSALAKPPPFSWTVAQGLRAVSWLLGRTVKS